MAKYHTDRSEPNRADGDTAYPSGHTQMDPGRYPLEELVAPPSTQSLNRSEEATAHSLGMTLRGLNASDKLTPLLIVNDDGSKRVLVQAGIWNIESELIKGVQDPSNLPQLSAAIDVSSEGEIERIFLQRKNGDQVKNVIASALNTHFPGLGSRNTTSSDRAYFFEGVIWALELDLDKKKPAQTLNEDSPAGSRMEREPLQALIAWHFKNTLPNRNGVGIEAVCPYDDVGYPWPEQGNDPAVQVKIKNNNGFGFSNVTELTFNMDEGKIEINRYRTIFGMAGKSESITIELGSNPRNSFFRYWGVVNGLTVTS